MSKAPDLRKTVRQLATHPIFSSRWFQMLGALQQATDSALIEKAEHGETEDHSTLWERKELTVRYLLEEGKLNLCLRLLIEFKSLQRQELFADTLVQAKKAEPTFEFDDLQTIKIKAALFEQCLGMLLSCALCSIESLQTLDIPALLQHIGETLKFSLQHPEMVKAPDAERRQETQEDRILELIQEYSICPLLIQNASVFHPHYSVVTKTAAAQPLEKDVLESCTPYIQHGFTCSCKSLRWKGAQALAGVFASEAYKTTPTAFVTTVEMKKAVIELEAAFLKVLKVYGLATRSLRADLQNISDVQLLRLIDTSITPAGITVL